MKIVVLASGAGSNFYHLATHFPVSLLICNKPGAGCIDLANQLNIESRVITKNAELFTTLKEFNPDLICLAGYMRILDQAVVSYFAQKIINIHPSLLPKYPGLHAFEQSFMYEDILGVTVHYVDQGVDTGPIIGQRKFKNTKNYTQCCQLLKQHEHELYYEVVKQIVRRNDEKTSVD